MGWKGVEMKRLSDYLLGFESYLKGLGLHPQTVRNRVRMVERFLEHLIDQDKILPNHVTPEDIVGFLKNLKRSKTHFRKPYRSATLRGFLVDLKSFFRFLDRREVLLKNPFESLSLTIKVVSKERSIFTVKEMGRFLDAVDPETDPGNCNRTLLELAYATGLRTGELFKLDLSDIDLSTRTLHVREGKGGKDRYVPFTLAAAAFLQQYMSGARNRILAVRYRDRFPTEDENALFVTPYRRMTKDVLYRVFHEILEKTCLDRKGLTPYSIRHSTATHLLEAGAGVRYVQELLGHSNIQTTVRYTHLQHTGLKKVYLSAHPRETRFKFEMGRAYQNRVEQLKTDLIKQKIKTDKERERLIKTTRK